MSAYLFTAIATLSQVRMTTGRYGPAESYETWDSCTARIVLGDDLETAQEQLTAQLQTRHEGKHPLEVQIRLVTSAQFVDQWFKEGGDAPLDWAEIVKQVRAQLEATQADDFEQGYWLDVETAVRPGRLSANIEALQRDLPEDIRAGLNWSADRQFNYLVTIFTTPPPPPDYVNGPEPGPAESTEEDAAADDAAEMQRLLAVFPQAADKDAVAVVTARNSAVAAWLWRRFAANTRLATNAIRIDSGCEIVLPEQGKDGGGA